MRLRPTSVLAVARHDLLDLRRQRGVWLGLLLIPFVTISFLLLLPGVLSEREEARQARAVYLVGVEATEADLAVLANGFATDRFRLRTVDDARAAVTDRTVDVGITPVGSVAAALADERGQIQADLIVLSGRSRSRAAAGAVASALDDFALDVTDRRLTDRGLSPATVRPLVVEAVDLSETGRGRRLTLATLLPLMVLLPVASTVGVAAQRISGSKDQRVFEPLLVLPLTRLELLLGKAASSVTTGGITVAAVGLPLLAGRFVPLGAGGRTVDLPIGEVAGVMAIATILLVLLVALGLTVGAVSRTSAELGSVLQMATLPLFLLGSLLQFRSGIVSTPQLLVTPFFGLLLCVRDVAVGSLTALNLATALAATVGWSLLLILVAVRVLESERSVLRSTS